MKIRKLDALHKLVDKKLLNSKVEFDYLDSNKANFKITNNAKSLLGKITLSDNKISFEDVSSNYSKKYLGSLLSNAVKDSGLEHKISFRTFSEGDILYLDNNLTGQNRISNFSYYGFNTHTDCAERKCYQNLSVTYLGLDEIMCGGTNPNYYAKYRVN